MRTIVFGFVVLPSVLALGCSSSDGKDTGPAGTNDPLAACPKDPAERTSPCVDDVGLRICPTHTGSPGDGLAVCPPEADEAIFVHYGPEDYDDPAQISAFTLAPGDEDENCTWVRTSNDSEIYIDGYHGRMRPHSHHLIITQVPEEGFVEKSIPEKCNLLDVVGAKWLVGSQSPQIDVLVSGATLNDPTAQPSPPGAPDYQLAQVLPAHQPLRVDLHYVNTTNKPLLREAWVSLATTDQAHTTTIVDMLTWFQGQITLPPKAKTTTERAVCKAESDRYLGLVTGHAHQRMTRESVWVNHADKTSDLVYETYNWSEPGELYYRDSAHNPAPDPAALRTGGTSGYQLVKKGETVAFECEYDNPTDATITLGETTKQEMCNVFGMYYPTDGKAWTCACFGAGCLDSLPPGLNPFANLPQ